MSLLERMHMGTARTSKDMGQKEWDAFLYGITVGWGEDEDDLPEDEKLLPGIKEEFEERFGWTEKDWENLQALRRTFRELSDE